MSVVQSGCRTRRWLNVFSLLLGFGLVAIASHAAPPETSSMSAKTDSDSLQQTKMDVVVIVWPTSESASRVAIAYRTIVDDNTISKEVSSLASSMGGLATNLSISRSSAHPDNLKQFPVSSTAMFTLTGCSQVHGRAPNLKPYIAAFQKRNYIEVVFAIQTMSDYLGPVKFDLPELSVLLIKEPDAYRYDVAIREHKKDLPEFPQNHLENEGRAESTHPDTAPPATPTEPRVSRTSPATIASMFGFVSIIVTLVIYLVSTSRSNTQSRQTHRTNH